MPSMGGIEKLANARRGHRAAEQIALRFRHGAVGADELELFVGFDTFDDNGHAEIGAQTRYAAEQRQRPIRLDPVEERAVDLDLLKREIVQITETRITGAEVIERNPHACRA